MNSNKSLSLRAVLVLFVLCILLPATVAVGGLVAWNVLQVWESREAELIATARSGSRAVDLRIAELSTAAEALATSEPVLTGDWARARPRIARLGLGADVWVAVSDGAGRRLLNTHPQIASDRAVTLPRPPSVLDALKSGEPVVSNLFVGAGTGRKVVAIDQAVPNSPEALVVSVVIEPLALLPKPGELGLPPEAIVTIVDRNRRVIARSSKHERFLGVRATPAMFAELEARPEGIVSNRSLEGDPTVVAYTRSERTGWTTMVVVPRSSVINPVLRNAAAFGIVAVGLLLLGMGLSRIVSGVLMRELGELERDAERLGHGRPVTPRPSRIENIERVQSALSAASAELRSRGARQQLLINELNHRVKNTLATVQGISIQTFRDGDPDAPTKFDQRLVALAGAHDLLTQSSWEAIGMQSVVARCADASAGGFISSGPDVLLPPQAALALCMCLHELTTNSLKYGALSLTGGKVLVSWTVQPAEGIDFVWKEQDGPPVAAPERRGFGSRLIDRLIKTELGGHIDRDFAPEGLTIVARFKPHESEIWRNSFD